MAQSGIPIRAGGGPFAVPMNPLGGSGRVGYGWGPSGPPRGSSPFAAKPTVRVTVNGGPIPPNSLLPSDPTGQSPTVSKPTPSQVLVAGKDSVVPVTYGGVDRIAGKLYTVRAAPSGALVQIIILSEGPVQGFPRAPQLNDVDFASTTGPTTPQTGATQYVCFPPSTSSATPIPITITMYDGTQTAVDPTVSSCGLTEFFAGFAYAVAVVPQGNSTGFPRFSFYLNGVLVHDPRLSSSFKWSGKKTLASDWGTNPTSFTRSTGAYFIDFESVLRFAPTSCARFTGMRFVQNLLADSENYTTANWAKSGNGVGTAPTANTGFSITYNGKVYGACRVQFALNGGTTTNDRSVLNPVSGPSSARRRVLTVILQSNTASSYVMNFRVGTSGSKMITVTPVPQRFSVYATADGDGTTWLAIRGGLAPVNANVADILVTAFQGEYVDLQGVVAPSEYVPMGTGLTFPFSGGGADGCRFFDYPNANLVNQTTWVVTEATGSGVKRWVGFSTVDKNYLLTPDSTKLDFSGGSDFDCRAQLLDGWDTSAGGKTLISKDETSLLREWFWRTASGNSSGIEFGWVDAGGVTRVANFSTGATNFTTPGVWARVTLQLNNGAGGHVVTLWSSMDGVNWTSVVTGNAGAFTTSMIKRTSRVCIGGDIENGTSAAWQGRVGTVQLYKGIAGTLVLDANPTRDHTGGHGVWLDDLTAMVTVPDIAALKYAGGNLTVECRAFVPYSDDTSGYLFSKPWNGGGQYNYRVQCRGGGKLRILLMGQGTGVNSWDSGDITAGFTAGVQHHVALTLDSSNNVILYVDGMVKYNAKHTITNWTPSLTDTNQPLAVGTLYPYGAGWAGDSTMVLNGHISEFRVWTLTRTQPQIVDNMNVSAASQEFGLSTYLKFDEALNDTRVWDYSLNANHGTLYNLGQRTLAPYWTSSTTGEVWGLSWLAGQVPQMYEAFTKQTMKGYRKEKATTNYVLNSNDLTQTSWTKRNGHVATNATSLAPDGTATASLITVTAPSAGISQGIYAESAAAGNAQYCYALWLMNASGITNVTMVIKDRVSDTIRATVKTVITSYWQRFFISGTTAGATTGFRVEFQAEQAGTFYVWDGQCEPGATPTSAFPSAATALTRPEDQLVFPNVSDTAGAVYCEIEQDDWTVNSSRVLGNSSGGAAAVLMVGTANSGVAAFDGTTTALGATGTPSGRLKVSCAWGAGTMEVFACSQTASNVTLIGGAVQPYDGAFGLTALAVGFGSASFQGHISGIEVYARKLSAAAIPAYFPTDYTYTWLPLEKSTDANIAWSDNPALILADFETNLIWGRRRSVVWKYAADAADYCDQLITGAAGTEKRARMTVTLDTRKPVREWTEVIRSYVPAWIDYIGQAVCIIADKPTTTTPFAFTPANIDDATPITLVKRGAKDIPNVVQVGFTRTDTNPWQTQYVEASTGSAVRRISRIDMPGIHSYSQALRYATERLNHYVLEDVEGTLDGFEDGIRFMVGDPITITDDMLGTNFPARITGKGDKGHGWWSIAYKQYDVNSYNNTVVATPAAPSTGMPDPRNVQPPTAVGTWAVEQLVKEADIADTAGSPALGFIYQSRINATWIASVHAYPVKYIVQVIDLVTNLVVDEKLVSGTSYMSPPIQQKRTFQVRVVAENALGVKSTALTTNVACLGNQAPPGDVPGFTTAFEIGGETILAWNAAPAIDTIRYEIQYGPSVGFIWFDAYTKIGNGTPLDRVDKLTASYKGIPVGPYTFAIKAVNSAGVYSTNAATVQITVTSDANAFITSYVTDVSLGTEAVQNGDFGSATGWTLGTGWTITGGQLVATAVANGTSASEVTRLTVGQWYKVTLDLVSLTQGASVSVGVGSGSSIALTGPGHYEEYMLCTTDGTVSISNNSGGAVTAVVDNFSMKPVGLANMVPFPVDEAFPSRPRWVTASGGSSAATATFNLLGPEKVINGDFASAGGWTLGTGITISGGTLNFATAGAAAAAQSVELEPNTTYTVEFDVTGFLSGVISCGGSAGTSFLPTNSNGHKIGTFTTGSPIDGNVYIGSAAGALTASFDNLTIKKVFNSLTSQPLAQFDSGPELWPSLDFSSSTGITLGTNASIANGKLSAAATPAGSVIARTTSTTVLQNGKTYVAYITVDAISAGKVDIMAGNGGPLFGAITAPGTYGPFTMSPTASSDGAIYVWAEAGTACTATIDNVSVRELTTKTWTAQGVDLGSTVTGDFATTWDVLNISGAPTFYIETAGSLAGPWTRQIGKAFKGSTRCFRPSVEGVGSCTFRVNNKPTLQVSAVTKTETGTAQTGPSGGTKLNGVAVTQGGSFVKLANSYTSATDLQATPVTSTATGQPTNAVSAVVDRVLLYPQEGLLVTYTISGSDQATTNAFLLSVFWTGAAGGGNYTIVANDWIEYDIFVDVGNPAFNNAAAGGGTFPGMSGAIDCTTNIGGGRFSAANKNILDATGQNIRSSQTAELAARGQWLTRQANLASMVGEAISQMEFGGDSDNNSVTANDYKMLIRNCRITNGQGGATRKVFYQTPGTPNSATSAGYEPTTVDNASLAALASNAQTGPANSFLVYTYTVSAGVFTLLNYQYKWSFKGY